MNDKTIISKFLSLEFPNEHPLIYMYVCGQKNIEQSIIDKIMSLTLKIFNPPISKNYILEIIKEYLENKKTLYKKNLIKVKSFYN